MNTKYLWFAFLFCALNLHLLQANNLVNNSAFDNAATTGWSTSGCCGGYVNQNGGPEGGGKSWLSVRGSLWQTLDAAPGQRYMLSFATRGEPFTTSAMVVRWGGQVVAAFPAPENQLWTYPNYILQATGRTELRFSITNLASPPKYIILPYGQVQLDNVYVVPVPPTQPTIELTSPSQEVRYSVGDVLPLTANLTVAPERHIVRVDYLHSGTKLIASATLPPFTNGWLATTPGTWLISARVIDSAGDSTTTTLKEITVAPRPTVFLDTPPSGAILSAGQATQFTARVVYNDGSITRLALRAGTNVVAIFEPVTNGLYSAAWNSPTLGEVEVEAAGYATNGNVFSMSRRTVSVLPPRLLDQQQTINDYSYVWMPVGETYAQTFTPGVHGYLHAVELGRVYGNQLSESLPIIITIRETVAGAPVGRVLAETTIPDVDAAYRTRTAYFRTNAPILRAGVLYAIVVSPGFQAGGVGIFSVPRGDFYPAGSMWAKEDPLGPWIQTEGQVTEFADMAFATYMLPEAPPSVTITPPAPGSYHAGDSISLAATANAADSRPVSVEFRAAGISIGLATNRPYAITWNDVPPGRYPLTAVATDSAGFWSQSEPVWINIAPRDNLPRISAHSARVMEGARTNYITAMITLSAVAWEDVSVDYSTANGSALANVDYQAVQGTVVFPPGTTAVFVRIPVYGDYIPEADKYFFLNLSSPAGATLDQSQGTCTIRDDEFVPGRVHHFVFSQVGPRQHTNHPFAVTISAVDSSNNLVTNFSDTVELTLTPAPAAVRHTMLNTNTRSEVMGRVAYYYAAPGYSFTPNTNLLVTGLRRVAHAYEISLWTDNGVLLATQPSSGSGERWIEEPLPNPVALTAGQTYRIGITTSYNWESLVTGPTTFAHGTIGPNFHRSGQGFPDGPATYFPLIDIAYQVDGAPAGAVEPSLLTQFVNGRWSGSLTLHPTISGNLRLRADDGFGHIGLSQPLAISARPIVEITSPVAEQNYYLPTNILIRAQVTDDEPNPTVDFYVDRQWIGTRINAPYDLLWTNARPGRHVIELVVHDQLGATASASTEIKVLPKQASRFDVTTMLTALNQSGRPYLRHHLYDSPDSIRHIQFSTQWIETNTINTKWVLLSQVVTATNTSAHASPMNDLVVVLDRRSVMRRVKLVDRKYHRRGVYSLDFPPIPPYGSTSFMIEYVVPNDRRMPEPRFIVPPVPDDY